MFALLSPLNLLDWEDSVADHGEYKQPFPIFRMIRQIVNSHIFVAQFRIVQYICVDITDLFAIEHYQILLPFPCPFISELSGSGRNEFISMSAFLFEDIPPIIHYKLLFMCKFELCSPSEKRLASGRKVQKYGRMICSIHYFAFPVDWLTSRGVWKFRLDSRRVPECSHD